jgi:ribonuclease E
MNLNNNRFGYDPDEYDDEPSDYVNSDTALPEDDLSKDTAEEFEEDDDEFVEVDDDEDLDELDSEVLDDSDVDEEDPINDDVSDYPESEDTEASYNEGKKPVFIKDMPYIDAR